MLAPGAAGVQARKAAAEHDRFVAFAFASAAIMIESGPDGTIGYATGAFRSEFGEPAEHYVGRHLRDLVAASDHDALADGLLLLRERGRLLPMTIRLSNARRTPLALSGLMLALKGSQPSFCLTLSALPSAPDSAIGTAQKLARAAEARLRSGARSVLQFLEVRGAAGLQGDAIGAALQAVAPGAMAGELAPGRFGVLSDDSGHSSDGKTIVAMLEQALRDGGMAVDIASRALTLSAEGLSPNQAARALRNALTGFARNGGQALTEAGFGAGLAGYLQVASAHASALRQAIRTGRFDMVHQPIVTLTDRQIHHYEALIRPQPIPGCPFETPQEFVLLVETLGLADEMDSAVAQKACDAAALASVSVAFNMSAQSAQNPAFRTRLLGLLEPHEAVLGGRIAVELTETADIEDLEETIRTVTSLRGIGITFCMDDFGAGTADVRLLRALGADIVKLDGSYTPGVTASGRDRAFVTGMIDIARAAGAEIVAERIETQEEADTLLSLGAQYGQGWLFSRPGSLPGALPGPLPAPLPSAPLPSAPLPSAPLPPAAGRRRGGKDGWG